MGGHLIEVASPRELGGRSHAGAEVSFKAEGPLAGRPLPQLPGASEGAGSLQPSRTADGIVTLTPASPTRVVAELDGWAGPPGSTSCLGWPSAAPRWKTSTCA